MSKNLLRSKTFWVNVLGVAAAVLSGQFGLIVPTEYAITGLAIVNVLLRLVTAVPAHVLPEDPQ